MSCKETFSMFDLNESSDLQTPLPRIPINDEMMSFASESEELTPQTNFDILLNKHLNNHEITDIQLQQLPQHQRNALVQIQSKKESKKKRPDQCQKLFYKRAFKFSQMKYFKKSKNKSRKMSHFYHFHFDSVATAEQLPITQFYHPNKKTKPGLLKGHRTFNSKYVKLLLKSKSFLEDVREYHKIFIEDCLKQRHKKIITFTKSLQRILNRIDKEPKQLVRYLQSSQCKIPWTLSQINETWDLAQRDLDQIFEQTEVYDIKGCQAKSKVPLGQFEQQFSQK